MNLAIANLTLCSGIAIGFAIFLLLKLAIYEALTHLMGGVFSFVVCVVLQTGVPYLAMTYFAPKIANEPILVFAAATGLSLGCGAAQLLHLLYRWMTGFGIEQSADA